MSCHDPHVISHLRLLYLGIGVGAGFKVKVILHDHKWLAYSEVDQDLSLCDQLPTIVIFQVW